MSKLALSKVSLRSSGSAARSIMPASLFITCLWCVSTTRNTNYGTLKSSCTPSRCCGPCVTAVTGLVLKVYGDAVLWCWVSDTHETFRWAAFYGPLWLMILIVSASCICIFDNVRRIERAAQRHRLFETSSAVASEERRCSEWERQQQSPSGMVNITSSRISAEGACSSTTDAPASSRQQLQQNYRRSRRTREVANQSFMYAGAFYLNWAALTVRWKACRSSANATDLCDPSERFLAIHSLTHFATDC